MSTDPVSSNPQAKKPIGIGSDYSKQIMENLDIIKNSSPRIKGLFEILSKPSTTNEQREAALNLLLKYVSADSDKERNEILGQSVREFRKTNPTLEREHLQMLC